MANPQRPTHVTPNIEVPQDIRAVYANLVRIAHSPSELVLDFAHLLPGIPTTYVNARIIMSPLGAKLLYRALGENLQRYEAAFGEIKVPGESSLADYLFRPLNPPDQRPENKPDSPPSPPAE